MTTRNSVMAGAVAARSKVTARHRVASAKVCSTGGEMAAAASTEVSATSTAAPTVSARRVGHQRSARGNRDRDQHT